MIKFLKDHYGDYQKLSAGSDLLAVSILMGNLRPEARGAARKRRPAASSRMGSLLYGDSFFASHGRVWRRTTAPILESVPSERQRSRKAGNGWLLRHLRGLHVRSHPCMQQPRDRSGAWSLSGALALQSAKDDSELDKAAASVKVLTPNQAVTYEARDWFASQF